MSPSIQAIVPIGLHWPTLDPFLFCAHHCDVYPAGTAEMGVSPEALRGRNIGQDFTLKDGWRMYHGDTVPGFPRHPHRGFETITLAQRGLIDHCDSMGAAARFGNGDVQWMTAGEGVVHSEMFPLVNTTGDNTAELFQIWLNLPARSKRCTPYFTMIWREDTPVVSVMDADGKQTQVTVLVGQYQGANGAASPPDSWAATPDNNVQVWRIEIPPNGKWSLPATRGSSHRVLYFYEGSRVIADGQTVDVKHGLQLVPDEDVLLEAKGASAHLLLLQGEPIGEPVAQQGPFVMNTREELYQAFSDYRRTQFGDWPWSSDDPVHPRDAARFARHPDGRTEQP